MMAEALGAPVEGRGRALKRARAFDGWVRQSALRLFCDRGAAVAEFACGKVCNLSARACPSSLSCRDSGVRACGVATAVRTCEQALSTAGVHVFVCTRVCLSVCHCAPASAGGVQALVARASF